MSAYIVDKATIDPIVTEAIRSRAYAYHLDQVHKLETDEDRDELGRILWMENRRSVAFRYPDDADGDHPGPVGLSEWHMLAYEHRRADIKVPATYCNTHFECREDCENRRHPDPTAYTRLGILKAIACYEYQSCEHPEWRDSLAHAWIAAIRNRATERILELHPEWEAAPWGLSESDAQRSAFA